MIKIRSTRRLLLIILVGSFGVGSSHAQKFGTTGSIERLDDAINALVPANAKIEVLAKGFQWSEGPVWLPSENCLLFSDVPTNKVHRWDETSGLTTALFPSGYTGKKPAANREQGSNGLTLDQNNRLLLCQHGDRRVARMTADLNNPQSNFETLAGKFQGKRFNSPNDLTVHSSGSIHFTDPPYGIDKLLNDPAKELTIQGVYRLDSDGEVHLLTDELSFPNGICFSPDEQFLYVAVSDSKRPVIMRYPVNSDGGIGKGAVFFDAKKLSKDGRRKGLPDGLRVDRLGNLFATGPGGVLVISPNGLHLGTIRTPDATANCEFGGPDRSTLYMTSHRKLLRVKLTTTK